MDIGLPTPAPPPPARYADKQSRSSSHAHHKTSTSSSVAPSTPNKHVNFTSSNEEKKREKFLTAKYGAHQMALIRKRLRVEMWMYERLQELYGAVSITNLAI